MPRRPRRSAPVTAFRGSRRRPGGSLADAAPDEAHRQPRSKALPLRPPLSSRVPHPAAGWAAPPPHQARPAFGASRGGRTAPSASGAAGSAGSARHAHGTSQPLRSPRGRRPGHAATSGTSGGPGPPGAPAPQQRVIPAAMFHCIVLASVSGPRQPLPPQGRVAIRRRR